MASGSTDTEHGPLSLVAGMKRDLECVVCLDEKELRCLSCTHRVCVECGDKIIKKAEERGGSGNAVAECPVCSEVILKPMLQYDVYEPSRIFCNPLKQLSEILKQDALNMCQNEECGKRNQVVKFCRQCRKYLCFICDRDGPCEGDDDDHDSVDTDKLAEECRESLELWKQTKTTQRDHLSNKKGQLCEELKVLADMLAKMPDTEAVVTAVIEEGHVTNMSNSAGKLAAVARQLSNIESELHFVISNTVQICDIELIRLVEQLDFREIQAQRKLGRMMTVIRDDIVKDVRLGPDGNLLIGMENKFCVVEIGQEDTYIARTVNIPGYTVYAVNMIKTETINLIVVSLSTSTSSLVKDKIHIYSMPDYEFRRSWEIPLSTDVTVCRNRIYVATALESEIKVFDVLTKDELAPIIRNGSCGGVTSIPPNSLLVNDEESNLVQKYKINTVNGKWTVAWSAELTKPWASCVDSQGSIWVRSNLNDCITIFSKSGVKLQDIMDDRISHYGRVWGHYVVSDMLWLATDRGLIYFDIEYEG